MTELLLLLITLLCCYYFTSLIGYRTSRQRVLLTIALTLIGLFFKLINEVLP